MGWSTALEDYSRLYFEVDSTILCNQLTTPGALFHYHDIHTLLRFDQDLVEWLYVQYIHTRKGKPGTARHGEGDLGRTGTGTPYSMYTRYWYSNSPLKVQDVEGVGKLNAGDILL